MRRRAPPEGRRGFENCDPPARELASGTLTMCNSRCANGTASKISGLAVHIRGAASHSDARIPFGRIGNPRPRLYRPNFLSPLLSMTCIKAKRATRPSIESPANYWKFWSHPPGSNWRPADYESAALPTELGWRSFITFCLQGADKLRIFLDFSM